jgi:hypothetical protein
LQQREMNINKNDEDPARAESETDATKNKTGETLLG